ncbi:MAG: hypothetical protein JRF33_08070 [Deltaproteobacteria bacterium]|nr:hypothetical protein [Deltaproteobacteria bacterium]
MAGGRFTKYIKRAFIQHWNLLALAAGTAIGFVSGHPDVVLPLVAAVEVVYLAGLATHPKFQKAIDAEAHKANKGQEATRTAEKSRVMLEALKPEDRQRFEKLRGLCFHLKRISQGIKGSPEQNTGIIEDMQSSGINRLLWLYLKLLYSKGALENFFDTIDENEIQRHVEKAEKRLKELGDPVENESMTKTKQRKSLADTLATSKKRLDNYSRATEKHEFIELELDRLYTKIASLGEMGINRQDASTITSEVDTVSASVQQTEKAMSELEFLSGLETTDDAPPQLLDDESMEQFDS